MEMLDMLAKDKAEKPRNDMPIGRFLPGVRINNDSVVAATERDKDKFDEYYQ